jgi:BirA family biotin operon repressor/biotin-[acetyl-CoA-carboxylase] ligase
VDLAPDLDPSALAEVLGRRPLRSYPAVLSVDADAQAWARAGAVHGSVVVADYQASPRGRGGLPWQVEQGRGLGFAVVVRPSLPPGREGWLYDVATAALADVLAAGSTEGDDGIGVEWPDQVVGTEPLAAVGITTEVDAVGVAWAVVNVLVTEASPPRGPLLARILRAVEHRLEEDAASLLEEHRRRCRTLGRAVRAHLVPVGPAGVRVEGTAVDLLADGALVIEGERGRRTAVLPHHLGLLEEPDGELPRP